MNRCERVPPIQCAQRSQNSGGISGVHSGENGAALSLALAVAFFFSFLLQRHSDINTLPNLNLKLSRSSCGPSFFSATSV